MPSPHEQAHRAERLGAAERRVKAFELAKAGAPYRAIGKALNVSHAQAQRDVVHVLAELNALALDHARDLRRLQLERLDALLLGVWQAATSGDVAAGAQALRILERQARLLGLDAPARIDVEMRIRAMAEQLGLDPDDAVREATLILRSGSA